MDENYYRILTIAMIFSFLLPAGYIVGRNQQYTQLPENPDYRNHITGLNLVALKPGNYSFPLLIENPYDNMTIRIYMFLFSDPEDYRNYVTLTSSVDNATRLNPLQSVNAVFDLAISENPYDDGELYVRVGCWRVGVDY